ncbi:hypothetical protein B0H67DRAFT_567833 [Lasiosphaeris hirsuta]|uniref:Uncharacterized protein n=1 Tax=Lasiosphaeris hirsuta TaxID=260670 RepID=A0AA40AYQ1_9PEZI|nr:hypothetical protein B0H67DRAFT_567833 [Lasiosphaeris hirsuta]
MVPPQSRPCRQRRLFGRHFGAGQRRPVPRPHSQLQQPDRRGAMAIRARRQRPLLHLQQSLGLR